MTTNSTIAAWLAALALCASMAKAGDTPSDMLPADTYIYVSVNDLAAMAKSWDSMPLGRIAKEQEVVDFLQQPLSVLRGLVKQSIDEIKDQDAFKDLDLDPEKIINTNYKQLFAALTRLEFAPEMFDAPPSLGLVVGVAPLEGTTDPISLISMALSKELEGETEASFNKAEHAGIAYDYIDIQEEGAPDLCFAKVGGLTLFTVSREALHQFIDRAKSGPEDCLSNNSEFKSMAERLDASNSAGATLYIDSDRMLKKIATVAKAAMENENDTKAIAAKFDELYGGTGLHTVGATMASWLSGDNLGRTRSLTRFNAEPTGLIKTMIPKKVDRSKLSLVPENATYFSLARIDIPRLYAQIFELLKAADADTHGQVEGMVKQVAASMGANEDFDLHRDFLSGLGTQFLSYSSASQGMMSIGDMIFLIEVTDQAKVLGGLKMLFALPAAMGEAPLALKETPFQDTILYSIDFSSIPGAAMAASFAEPSFCFSNGNLIIGVNQSGIKSVITRMGGGDHKDITSKEDFKRFYAKVPEDAASISYADFRTNFESSYAMLVSATVMPGVSDYIDMLPIDMALMPTSESLAKHLFGSVGFTSFSGNEYRTENYGPIGSEMIPIIAGACLGGVAGATVARGEMEAPPPFLLDDAGEMSDVDRIDTDLGALMGAITVFNLDQGELPSAIEDLMKPSESFPEGYLTAGKLLSDPWGNPYRYSKTGRLEYRLWSIGPNGTDEQGEGDDLVRSR